MKNSIKELQQKVELYENILDNAKAMIYVIRPDKVIYHNKTTTEVTGFTIEDINKIGLSAYQKKVHHPDDANLLKDVQQQLALTKGDNTTVIWRQIDKNEKWISVLASSKVLKCTKDGTPIEAVNCALILPDEFDECSKIGNLLKENARLKNKIKLKELTKREIETLRCIAKGSTTKEIANEMNISFHTVETHRKNIGHKLNIHHLADLVRFAVESGL